MVRNDLAGIKLEQSGEAPTGQGGFLALARQPKSASFSTRWSLARGTEISRACDHHPGESPILDPEVLSLEWDDAASLFRSQKISLGKGSIWANSFSLVFRPTKPGLLGKTDQRKRLLIGEARRLLQGFKRIYHVLTRFRRNMECSKVALEFFKRSPSVERSETTSSSWRIRFSFWDRSFRCFLAVFCVLRKKPFQGCRDRL